MKFVIKALNNMIALSDFLKKWNIMDKNLNQGFIFLIHYYKFKLVEDNSEKITIDIFNKYDTGQMYENDKPLFFDKFFDIVSDVIKKLTKKSFLVIFDSVLIEVVGKLFFFFFSTIAEMLDHEDFGLTIAKQAHWLNELSTVEKKLSRVIKKVLKNLRKNTNGVKTILHQQYILSKVAEMKANIFRKMSETIKQDLLTYLEENKEDKINFKKPFDSISEKFKNDVKLENNLKSERQRVIIEALLITAVIHLSENYETHDDAKMNKVAMQLYKYIIETGDKEENAQLLFVELYFKFMKKSTKKQDVLNSLSTLSTVLNTKLSRRNLTDIVNGKQFRSDRERDIYFQVIFQHFKRNKRLQQTTTNKIRFSGKVRVTVICMEFLYKLKNINFYRSKMIFRKESKAEEEEENPFASPPDQTDQSKLADMKLKFAFLTPQVMKLKYKGIHFEEVWVKQC